MSQNITKIKQEMVGYKYKHYKNGKIYLVLDIVIHTETQELMVVYKNINDEQIWCRPLSIFNEEIDNEHHKRFEKIDDDRDWKKQQEQAILKELFKIGYSVHYSQDNQYLIDFYNVEEMSVIKVNKKSKRYIKVESVYYTSFVPITSEEHYWLHRLFEIWGFFDE